MLWIPVCTNKECDHHTTKNPQYKDLEGNNCMICGFDDIEECPDLTITKEE